MAFHHAQGDIKLLLPGKLNGDGRQCREADTTGLITGSSVCLFVRVEQ